MAQARPATSGGLNKSCRPHKAVACTQLRACSRGLAKGGNLSDKFPIVPQTTFNLGRGQACQRGGSMREGSIGLPWRRISKCSCTRSASLAPISAIFWPRLTAWSSLTSKAWLCA